MIKILDGEFALYDEFKDFCKNDSFGTRIYSHFLSYGVSLSFVDFWVQISDSGRITSVICKIESDLILSINDDADFEELSMFIGFQSKASVTFDERFSTLINDDNATVHIGDILRYVSLKKVLCRYETTVPKLKDYHNLLLKCKSENFFVPDYLDFLSDVSRRIQRKMCDVSGIYLDSQLVSCAMTVSYTDFSVILGAVATHPDYRKQGLGACVVGALARRYSYTNNVYIYTTVKRNTLFYQGIGFEVCGKWIKYTYGG